MWSFSSGDCRRVSEVLISDTDTWPCVSRLPSQRRLGFNPTEVCMWFVVDKVTLEQVFLELLWFYPASIIPPLLRTQSLICHRRCVILTIDVVHWGRNVVRGCSRTECWGGRGSWEVRRLHDGELYALYSSPNTIHVIKSRRLRWSVHVARMGEKKGTYRVSVGKPEGRWRLRRPRRKREDNIKMDIREGGWAHGLDRRGSR
jgi:hypothetical protein